MRYMMLELKRWAKSHGVSLDGVRVVIECPDQNTQYAFEAGILMDTKPYTIAEYVPLNADRRKGTLNGVPYEIAVRKV